MKTKTHYISPDLCLCRTVSPTGILCSSIVYGFESTNGVIDGEANSAGNDYGLVDNGEY
ncbi:MAG: hypothetical protein PUB45_01505 [Bacteroidales bacterium]|nr:hypothetical protein [Bacteroidales bacterium]